MLSLSLHQLWGTMGDGGDYGGPRRTTRKRILCHSIISYIKQKYTREVCVVVINEVRYSILTAGGNGPLYRCAPPNISLVVEVENISEIL